MKLLPLKFCYSVRRSIHLFSPQRAVKIFIRFAKHTQLFSFFPSTLMGLINLYSRAVATKIFCLKNLLDEFERKLATTQSSLLFRKLNRNYRIQESYLLNKIIYFLSKFNAAQSSNRKTRLQFDPRAKRKGVLPRQLEGMEFYPVTDPITRARVDEQTARLSCPSLSV